MCAKVHEVPNTISFDRSIWSGQVISRPYVVIYMGYLASIVLRRVNSICKQDIYQHFMPGSYLWFRLMRPDVFFDQKNLYKNSNPAKKPLITKRLR